MLIRPRWSEGDFVVGFEEIVLGAAAESKNAVSGEYLGIADPKPENPLISTAWTVLEAANDVGDVLAEACQRVIDANLNGTLPTRSDLNIIFDFFN
jgi:hypothetical protein